MAILSKIRERSVYLILIIGLALLAFVVDPSKIQSFFSSSGTNEIGEINGEEISRQDFAQMMENYQSRAGGKVSQTQIANVVWNGLMNEKIFKNQLDKSGIVVGEKDIWDAMVALPSIQNSPLFKNEAGLFSEEKLKEYIANLKADYEAGRKEGWLGWLETENNLKNQLQRKAYTSLVSQGVGVSIKEGAYDYILDNTKMDAQYVFVPYSSVDDNSIKVSTEEIKKYVESHPKTYKKEASRSLKFITFAITPSKEDEEAVKKEISNFINDREEYSSTTKSKITVKGFKNATNLKSYLDANGSDIPFNDSYFFTSELPKINETNWSSITVNDVVGPYKSGNYYKISKVTDIIKMPDSVKASHIIVPFSGATRATTTITKEQAKKQVDSLFAIVSKKPNQFAVIADKINSDGTKGKGGDIGWIVKKDAFSPYFDRSFANYIFKNKKGSIDVVESKFGYHIIKVNDQKHFNKAIQIVDFGRTIEPSEATENAIFEKAETLALDLSEGKKLEDVAKEKNYFVQSAENLKPLDESIPTIGNQRQIVSWAFKDNTNVGDYRRFDIDFSGKRGYIVAEVTNKVGDDEVAITGSILNTVRPILINAKKAKMIKDKILGNTLEEMAKSTDTKVQNVSDVTFANPLLSGVGNEPKVVGAMSGIPLDKLSNKIEGAKGVFVVKVSKRTEPKAMKSYSSYEEKRKKGLDSRMFQLFDILKEKAEIIDQRAKFF